MHTLIARNAGRLRDLVLALIVARVIDAQSKLATARRPVARERRLHPGRDAWARRRRSARTVCGDGLAGGAAGGHPSNAFAKQHLQEHTLVLYDLTSSYVEETPLPVGAARAQPRRQAGHLADRLRPVVHGRGLSGRGGGLRGLDERPEDGGLPGGQAPHPLWLAAGGAGGRPRHADRSADPRGPGGRRRAALDHHAAGADDSATAGRRHGDAVAVRRAGPGRGHQRAVPRRAAGRVPQSVAGRRAAAQAAGTAGGNREGPGAHRGSDNAPEPAATRSSRNRYARREGDQPAQDGQAFRHHDHRRHVHLSPGRSQDRGRGRSSTGCTSSAPTSSRSSSMQRRRCGPTRTCRRWSGRFGA